MTRIVINFRGVYATFTSLLRKSVMISKEAWNKHESTCNSKKVHIFWANFGDFYLKTPCSDFLNFMDYSVSFLRIRFRKRLSDLHLVDIWFQSWKKLKKLHFEVRIPPEPNIQKIRLIAFWKANRFSFKIKYSESLYAYFHVQRSGFNR